MVLHEELLARCLAKPGAYLDHPWGDEAPVVKVGGKIFCFLSSPDAPARIYVKNDPEIVEEWRTRFPDHAGFPRYLSRRTWLAVEWSVPGGPDADEAAELIDDSYALIVASLPKAKRPATSR